MAQDKSGAKDPGTPASSDDAPFWRKPLRALNQKEWESLCDGCGRCCLVKLEDEDTGQIHFTDVACRLLNAADGRCKNYKARQRHVTDCVRLTPANVTTLSWLPPTCAYRLRAADKDLPDWHPLVSGDPESVMRAGVSVRGRIAASEDDVALEDLPGNIVRWPNRWPPRLRPRR